MNALVLLMLLLSPVAAAAQPIVGKSLVVEVRPFNGAPTLFVNSQPRSSLLHFFSWSQPGLDTLQWTKQAGFRLYSAGIPMKWPRPGEAQDFRADDALIEKILARDPQAMFLPRFIVDRSSWEEHKSSWWEDAHPDDLMQWSTGDGLVREPKKISVASERFRETANRLLRSFVEHLESKYGDRIIGYHPCGQNSCEWFYHDSWTRKLNCCEPVFVAAFQRWAANKYGSVDKLREAWSDPNVTFETITGPTREERLCGGCEFFRDPTKERRVIDFVECQNVAVVETLEKFARTIKEATKGRKSVVVFYGYTFELAAIAHGLPNSGHLALGRLLKCPDVDIICSPISYVDRGSGGVGAFTSPVDSVSLHGKLWINEDDTRTHLGSKGGFERTETPWQTREVHARNFAHILPRRAGAWWMDQGAGWLNDEVLWRDLSALKRLYDNAQKTMVSFKPEIAVIVDEKSCFYLTQKPWPFTRDLLYLIRQSLYRIGTPCGFYLLEDLVSGRIPPAKLYLFLNNFALTAQDKQAIAARCAGKVCVFFYANGFIDKTADARNMEDLLGSRMTISMDGAPGKLKAAVDPLTGDVSEFGVGAILTPVFYLDEGENGNVAGVRVFGRYANGRAGAWFREGKPYRRVYLGALAAPPSLLRNLARMAGVHVYVDTDDVVEADQEFLAIHASTDGRKRIVLPAPMAVHDALTEETVAISVNEWTVEMKKGETRIYKLQVRQVR